MVGGDNGALRHVMKILEARKETGSAIINVLAVVKATKEELVQASNLIRLFIIISYHNSTQVFSWFV